MKRFLSVFLIAVMCCTFAFAVSGEERDFSKVEVQAAQLKELGLFRGVSENDFALERAPSRIEALVMLIRVLGKENEVTNDVWKHPFTDVPAWADNYVGYAYSKGLTNGESDTRFGTGNANAATYLTFVLRALGYSDTNGKDFSWNDPYILSEETGILSDEVDIENFLRADVVIVSYKALSSYINGADYTLAEKLVQAGLFTQRQFDSVYYLPDDSDNQQEETVAELTSEQIYEKCSSAVFYIEVYDKNANAYASGSGFFIDDKGTAVTNFHVIDGAYAALIQTSDTQNIYVVEGVYDCSSTEDWAVIKVQCAGNKYLKMNTDAVTGGAKIYALGSPLGLQNTISEGLVANPERFFDDISYIQINAPISSGNSGGALLNKKGEVIGIPTWGITVGQNLNFALPVSYIADYKTDKYIDFTGEDSINDLIVESNYKELKKWLKNNVELSKEGFCYGESFYENVYFFGLDLSSVDSFGWFMAYSDKDSTRCKVNLESKFYEYSYLDFKVCGFLPDSELGMYDVLSYVEYEGDKDVKQDVLWRAKYEIYFICSWFNRFLEENNFDFSLYDLGMYPIDIDFSKNPLKNSVTYELSASAVMLEVYETKTITFDYSCTGIREDISFYIVVDDPSIVEAYWVDSEDDTLPWKIAISGLSKGETQLRIYNDYNDQYAYVKIYV